MTTGHETEAIDVQGLKASLQEFKDQIIDPMRSPTYDATNKRYTFPANATFEYQAANKRIILSH